MLTLTAVFLAGFLGYLRRPLLIVLIIPLHINNLLHYPLHALNCMLDNLLREVVPRLMPVLLQLIMTGSKRYVLFDPGPNLLYRIEIRRVWRPIFAHEVYNVCPEEVIRVGLVR